MTSPKALIFDVGGTIFDWKTTVVKELKRTSGETLSAEVCYNFADDWRTKMFEFRSQVADGHTYWMNADEMLLKSLDALESEYSFIEGINSRPDFVRKIWHNLQLFNGAKAGLSRLRTEYTVIVLTVLSWASAVNSSKHAGIEWDGILSCEIIGYYKPSLMAYKKAVKLLGLKPHEAMMVASHETDLAAAKTAGLQTAFITPMSEDDIFKAEFADEDAFKFDLTAPNFDGLCTQLGC